MKDRTVVLVFLGGTVGGALRILIDYWIPSIGSPSWEVPWDVVAINVLGSALLGALNGWALVMGRAWWFPMVGTGVLGGFTTFSAIAALPWAADTGLIQGAVVLGGTMLVSVVAAAAGWRWGVRRADAVEATA
ncbi:CrcB family protein [Demequina sp. B12]|uniref:fluoride efflux transporter FluC n=1 Tax=Demequina sp. B12 TaxID=2992757 RepID=UPI00237B5CAF|nr:CrcB family protein [Demequina sp. B12]MDE0572574.1 CrcB family protein [Demequina sp. B12]